MKLTTEFRELDTRLGRWWSRDPIIHEWENPYPGFGNNPVLYMDPRGLSQTDPNKFVGPFETNTDGSLDYEGSHFEKDQSGKWQYSTPPIEVQGNNWTLNDDRQYFNSHPNEFIAADGFNAIIGGTWKGILNSSTFGLLNIITSEQPSITLSQQIENNVTSAVEITSDVATALVPAVGVGKAAIKIVGKEMIEEGAEGLDKSLHRKVGDLIHGSLKRSKSYHSPYETKTYEELSTLAKSGDQKAKKMLKLIKETPRLMKKNKGKNMNFINIKNMISSEIELSKLMMEFIFETRLRLIDKKVNDDKEILSKIVNQMSVYRANPILLDLLSDFLQLIDDENLLETFDLADIEKLLINNKKNQILDLSFTEDLIYWYWNVMDDGKQARDSILEIIPKLEEKLVEFKNLLSDIENDFTD